MKSIEPISSHWPDGTPQSRGNAFTRHLDGSPSCFALDRVFCPVGKTGASASHAATKSRETVEIGGRNIGTIVGLSKKSALSQADARRYHVSVSKGAKDGAAIR